MIPREAATKALATALPAAKLAAVAASRWAVEHAPVIGARAVRHRNRVVVGPYARPRTLTTTLFWIVAAPIGLVLCLIYGFFFGLTAPYLMVPFLVPIGLLAALIIWALPDQRTAPTLAIEFLIAAFIISKIVWPNYLAISLPGLPWISILRIIGLPLAAFFLISLSVSKVFRRYTYDSVTSIRPLWICAVGFSAVQILTIFVSKSPIASAQIAFDQHINFAMILALSCVIFRKNAMAENYMIILCSLSVFIVFLTFIENQKQYIIWASHIPRIIRPDAPSVDLTLKPAFRLYVNIYRAKATFSTPLALAEFISLIVPFFLYFTLSNAKPILRVFCFLMVPLTFIAVRMTDARLGVVGVFGSILLYGLIWSFARWRARPRDLFAAATVFAYPVVFLAAVGAIFASTRLSNMVFGGGAQAGSTEARSTQLGMAAASFWRQPWGYGAGQSGLEMGFAKDAFITIDNYFIGIQLDYGLFGIIFWYGMFISGIAAALLHALSDRYANRPEARLLIPLAVSLTVFLVIKWVHGQDENHAIFFLMLGMVSALVYRLRHGAAQAPEALR